MNNKDKNLLLPKLTDDI